MKTKIAVSSTEFKPWQKKMIEKEVITFIQCFRLNEVVESVTITPTLIDGRGILGGLFLDFNDSDYKKWRILLECDALDNQRLFRKTLIHELGHGVEKYLREAPVKTGRKSLCGDYECLYEYVVEKHNDMFVNGYLKQRVRK